MNEQKINIGNSQREKIVTNQMKIAKNVFIYNDTFVPLNSISKVSVIKEREKQYSFKQIIVLVLGVLLLFVGDVFTVLGLVIIVGAGYLLYRTYAYNEEIGEYLKIEMNSGKSIYFYNKNHEFLVEIMDVMINCINTQKEYLISMDTYNIESCQFGNNNLMTNSKEG